MPRDGKKQPLLDSPGGAAGPSGSRDGIRAVQQQVDEVQSVMRAARF
jgi:hypothetical protein